MIERTNCSFQMLSIITVEKAVDTLVIWLKFAKYFFTATFQPSNPVLKESPSSWQGVAQLPRKEKAKLSPKTTQSICLLSSYSKDPRGPWVQSELSIESFFFILMPFKYKCINRTQKQTSNFGIAILIPRILQYRASSPTTCLAHTTLLCQALLKQCSDSDCHDKSSPSFLSSVFVCTRNNHGQDDYMMTGTALRRRRRMTDMPRSRPAYARLEQALIQTWS